LADPDRRVLSWLTVAAVLTRLLWVIWVHPPGAYVFSDMAHYVARAQGLLAHGFVPGVRDLAWQVWGTHYLLAGLFAVFGDRPPFFGAGVAWGLIGAATVPMTYLLATRVTARRWIQIGSGVAMLLWYPALSNGGYFLTETPFTLAQVVATYFFVLLLQEGRGAMGAGISGAIAFALRPQIAVFFVLALVLWWFRRRTLVWLDAGRLWRVSLPILLVFGFGLWRFHAHTGYWGPVAENANMNFTAARCHNIVTQAFPDEEAFALSESRASTVDGRRVSLPGYRVLSQLPDSHPFALRPALGHESIKIIGYIGDPDVHREVRRRCYAGTGTQEQLRYTLVNVSLLWFWGYQWPEVSDADAPRALFETTVVWREIDQWLVWLPSLIGLGWGLRELARPRGKWGLGLLALQLLVSIGVAAAFFGTIRLRLPYDPFALILALCVWDGAWQRAIRAREALRQKRRSSPNAD
jgi:hypothetical protein